MLYRSLAFYRETCVFPPVGLEKPLEILKPFLAQVITLVRLTNTPNLVEIGSQGAPPHSGEISHFCDLCSPSFFFRFLISPTGRNSEPIHTFNSSNDVFWFVHVLFESLEPSNSLLGGLRPKKYQTFDPICSRNCFSIRALESKLPLNVKITSQNKLFDWK